MTIQSRLQRWLLAFAAITLAITLVQAVAPPRTASAQTSPPGHYLIISADLFADHLDAFIALKQAQGFSVTLATLSQTGVTTSEILSYIKSLHSANPIQYLLLVGDDNFIPLWGDGTDPKTDLYYATMDGELDFLPEFPYGRLPVRNTIDLENWIAKMLVYEQASGRETWAKGASFIVSSDLGYSQDGELVHNTIITTHTQPAGFNGTFPYSPQPGGDRLFARTHSATHAHVVSALNSGRQIAVYFGSGSSTAWLDPIFSQADLRAMTGPPIPLVVALAPYTADFSTVESLADTWVTQANSGALAYIGCSTSNNSVENSDLEKAFFAKLFEGSSQTLSIGEALLAGVNKVAERSTGFSWRFHPYRESYQLFGDPSIKLILEPKPCDYSLRSQPAHVGVCRGGQATTQIQPLGRFDFDFPVILSIQGLPAGLSAGFDLNPVLPGGISTLTLTAADLPTGSYPLSILGGANELSRQTELNFSVHESQPEEVTLQSPAAFTPNTELRPDFTWSESAGALWYDLELATDHLFENGVLSITSLHEPRFIPGADLLPGTTYWWRVRAANPCGSSEFSLANRFTTRSVVGQCAAGGVRETLYNIDFENLASGWSSFGGLYPWDLVQTNSHSPSHSFFAGSWSTTPWDLKLISPLFSLPTFDPALLELVFWNRHDFEVISECRDGGLLEISTDNTVTWNPVPEEYLLNVPYDDLISSAHMNPLGNQRAWCGARDWTRVGVRLEEYMGEDVRFRWRLGTDQSGVEGEGWYLDDVSVERCVYPPPPAVSLTPTVSQLTGIIGETLSHTLLLTNAGQQPVDFVLYASGYAWQPLISPASVHLAAGASAQIAAAVTIPPEAQPGGVDQATLVAVSAADHAIHATARLETNISPYRLSLATLPPELEGYAGFPLTFSMRVTNTGVVTDTVSAALVAPAGWSFELPVEPFTLAPGESRDLAVTVFLPANAGGTTEEIILSASSVGGPGTGASLVVPVSINSPKRIYLPCLSR